MRRCCDVPLAPSIGIPAKRVTELGAPSLKHPVARVFSAIIATSPLASLKWGDADQSHRNNEKLRTIDAGTCSMIVIGILCISINHSKNLVGLPIYSNAALTHLAANGEAEVNTARTYTGSAR